MNPAIVVIAYNRPESLARPIEASRDTSGDFD